MRHTEKQLQAQITQLTQQLKNCQAELDQYKKRCEQASHAYDVLLQAFKQIQRRQFGSRSERFMDNNPAQGDLFADIEPQPLSDIKQPPETDENTQVQKKKRRRKKQTGQFAKNLPRREVIIPAENKGDNYRVIRYEITELLHYVPPIYEVIIQKREVVVSEDKEAKVCRLTIAPNPKRLLPKVGVTESFLTHIIVGKLYDRQPLYHLEKKFGQRFNFTCPRNKLARWFIDSAAPLQSLVNLLGDELYHYDVAFCDPTHLQVLDEPGRSPSTKSYVFTMKGGPPDKPVVLYKYNPDNHKQFLQHNFADYRGYLHVDGQNIFDVFENDPNITLLFCNSHARRKFEPIAKASQKIGLATEAMRYYKKLYAIERQAKKDNLTPQERYQLRQEKSKTLVDDFEHWLIQHAPLTLPQSPLGKAMDYVIKRIRGLRRFLDDGRLEIDTNELEQKNKDLALARNKIGRASCRERV